MATSLVKTTVKIRFRAYKKAASSAGMFGYRSSESTRVFKTMNTIMIVPKRLDKATE